ncbi:MAG TPA: YggT family protein [Candidatus Binatia bacterium]|jgi:YggT family protein|nr:YggT family protein [Candidatus Binatia bacterium]
MFVISNFLAALASVLNMLLSAYMWIIIIRALISWVSPDPYNPIVQFLRSATDPLLYRVRRWLPVSFGGIDFSPIVVIAALIFLQAFLVQSLLDLSRAFR